MKAGLDLAIVNSEKIVRYPSIPRRSGGSPKTCSSRAATIRSGRSRPTSRRRAPRRRPPSLAPERPLERLPRYILDGSKEGLVDDLEAVRTGGMAPLDIINGPLMDGMREVGRLFNANELIVAEVLQSAESMKASVNHLEQFMEKTTDSRKGKIILATVKGDVHDIGKNLVEIILSNNGYEVVNLGIKVPPERLVEAVQPAPPGPDRPVGAPRQERAADGDDGAGPDGARRLGAALLVGGAALSQKFTDQRIAPAYGGLAVYAVDAMRGLALADRILSGEGAPQRLAAEADARRIAAAAATAVSDGGRARSPRRRSAAPEIEVVEARPGARPRRARASATSTSRDAGRT